MEKITTFAMKVMNCYEDSYLDKEKRKAFEDLFDKYLTSMDMEGSLDVYDMILVLAKNHRREFERMMEEMRVHSLLPDK
jgi:hypothetical protein